MSNARGWKQHRLEANGLWQYTGQLRDQLPLELTNGVPYTEAAFDSNRVLINLFVARIFITKPGEPLAVGTLGWVPFSGPREQRLPPGTPTSDFEPPRRA